MAIAPPEEVEAEKEEELEEKEEELLELLLELLEETDMLKLPCMVFTRLFGLRGGGSEQLRRRAVARAASGGSPTSPTPCSSQRRPLRSSRSHHGFGLWGVHLPGAPTWRSVAPLPLHCARY